MNKQITVTQYAYWQKCKYSGEERFGIAEFDFRRWDAESRDGRVFVKEVETCFEVPEDFDPLPERIAVLEAEKVKARADFQARVTELDRQIQSLLAIEYTEASHG